MTFSIVGFDRENGDLGVAVQSKYLCVGSAVPFAESGVGAIATQANVNVSFGYHALDLLKKGHKPETVVSMLLANDPLKESRQVSLIDASGRVCTFTGSDCFTWAGHKIGSHYSCQGNILTNEDTLTAMATAYETERGDLTDKLLAALKAADRDGLGDKRGKQSAALYVVRKNSGFNRTSDILVDIRVDDHPEPIKELFRIFTLYELTFLNRNKNNDLLEINGEIAMNIGRVLEKLGYLPIDSNKINAIPSWNDTFHGALKNWFNINNFENKWNDGYTIDSSVYQYLKTENGSPMIVLD